MTELEGLIARPDGSLAPGAIRFADRIEMVVSRPAGNDYVLPGFIDLQVNGSHGIDVMTAGAEALVALAQHMAAEGTTTFLPTAVTSPLERIIGAHAAIGEAMSSRVGAPNAAAMPGMHLEGPFISPARLGAHPRLNLTPEGEPFDTIAQLPHLRLLTLAPELQGALVAIEKLAARGVVVSIGHTDATLEQAQAGVTAGARMFTHLYNAMRPLHHREPGVIAAALTASSATPAVIPDGVHVHPSMLRVAYRARGPEGLILTTDKVALAGTAPGNSASVGRARAKIEGGAARLADGTLAGSVISMLDGLRLMVERVGVPLGEAALMAATNPARLMGWGDRGALAVGRRADLVVLDQSLELKAVYIGGRELD